MGTKLATSQSRTEKELSPKQDSILSLFEEIFRDSVKYRMFGVACASAYWLLYAYSGGILFYYPFDVIAYLRHIGVANPSFSFDFSSFNAFYNSGVVWYPTQHIGLVLFIGPTAFSIALSVLFGLNMVLFAYSLRSKFRIEKRGLLGMAGIIPALFTGGCCVAPIATLLLGSVIPTTVLVEIEFGNSSLLLNLLGLSLMIFFIIYNARRIGSCKTMNIERNSTRLNRSKSV